MTLDSISFPSFSESSSRHGGGGEEESNEGREGVGQGGGGEENSGKTHLVWVTADMCRGFVVRSGGTKFCLERDCETPAHQGEKVGPSGAGFAAIKVPKRNQAFVEPTLPETLVPVGANPRDWNEVWATADALRAWIMNQRAGPQVNVDLMSQFDGTTDTPARRVGEEDLPTAHPSVRQVRMPKNTGSTTEFERAAQAIRTPARLERTFQDSRLQSLFEDKEINFHSLGSLEEIVAREVGKEELDLNDPKVQEAILRRLLGEIDSVGAATIEVGNAQRDLHAKVYAAVDVLDERFLRTQQSINMLGNALGEPTSKGEGATVWHSIAELQDQVSNDDTIRTEVEGRLQTEKLRVRDDIRKAKSEALIEVRNLEERVKAFLINVGQQFEQVLGAVRELSAAKPQAKKENLRHESRADDKPNYHPSAFQVNALEERMLNLEMAWGREKNDTKSDRVDAAFGELKSQEQRLKLLENKMTGDKVFRADGNRTYGSREDVLRLVERNSSEQNISGFLDMVTVFIIMDRPALTGTEHANRTHVSARAGRGAGDSEAMASLTHERPPILFGTTVDPGCTKLVQHTKGFGARLKDYAEYDENMYGMRYRMQTMIADLETSQMTGLDEDIEWNRVKSRMIRVAVGHANQLLSFITNMYRALTTTCKYSPGPAWNLVGRIVGTIFLTLKSIRARAMALEEIASPQSRATFVWTMMQSSMMMQEIIDRGFQSHPVIMKEIMEFQLENRVDASQIDAVHAEMKSLKAQFKEVQTGLAKVEKNGAAMSDKLNKLAQELGNLRTEVNKIKK